MPFLPLCLSVWDRWMGTAVPSDALCPPHRHVRLSVWEGSHPQPLLSTRGCWPQSCPSVRLQGLAQVAPGPPMLPGSSAKLPKAKQAG